MQLTFDREDEQGFAAAREVLLTRLSRWLENESRFTIIDGEQLTGEVGILLDWKWTYGDGELATWHVYDIAEFLLEWCPRKLSVTQTDSVTIPLSVAAFMTFLHVEDLLDRDSSSVKLLAETTTSLADEFIAAMGDRSKFGLAKSMFTAAVDEGVDPTDQEGIRAWMDGFNDRPEEERFRILPDSAFTEPPPGPSLAPIVIPSDEDVASSREAAPILRMFRDLAIYIGAGRKLTQKGHLTLADARVLVERLGTGDQMDASFGERTYRTTSSDDLYRLRQVFAWAKKAGIVRVVHGKVVATKQGAGLIDGVGPNFDRALDALMALGPLTSQRSPRARLRWPEVDKALDQASPHLLIAPYTVQGPIPIVEIADTAVKVVLQAFTFRIEDDRVARRVANDVVDIMDAFELAGLLTRTGVGDPGDGRRRTGGSVELTSAGITSVRRLLVAAGYDAPEVGRFVQASASELLLGTTDLEFEVFQGELQAWLAARAPEKAAAEIYEAVRKLDDPILQNLGLDILGVIGTDIATSFVKKLTLEPQIRGFARCWLVDNGQADEKELFDPADVHSFVDVLAHRILTGGPEEFLSTLALAGDHSRQTDVVSKMWNAPSPATELVLTAVTHVHSTKVVVKAARKALFKRGSSLGIG